MQKYLPALSKSKIFADIPQGELEELLRDLHVRVRRYAKGRYIAFQGERLAGAGVVLSGKIRLQKETEQGVFILNDYKSGDTFGEGLSFVSDGALPFNILTVADAEIMFVDLSRAVNYPRLAQNIIRAFAERVLFFHEKLDVLREHTIRGRLLRFFEGFYARHGDGYFSVPFNRNALAEYLSVNRSALSRELGNMKREGIIDCRKNKFKICIPLFKKM